MKNYEVVREVLDPCGHEPQGKDREILELRLEDPAVYVQDQYRRERTVEFLTASRDGCPVIEAVLEGGRKHRYTFCEL